MRLAEDLRGEREIVNSKSEEEEDEKEWVGEEGRVLDLGLGFGLGFFSLLFPIS